MTCATINMQQQPTLRGDEEEEIIIALVRDHATRERGFARLMTAYQERLYWHIRRLVTEHADADDVLQDTLVKVYRNIEQFKGESKLFTWLYRIATNEAINFLTKKQRWQTESISDNESFNLYAQHLKADTYFEGDKAQLRLQAALATLPHKQRLVFNMRYFDEMDYKEMANVLETSVGALKASYHIAVKKIENLLTE